MRSDLENGITVSSTVRAPSAEALQNAPDLASPCASNENSCFRESININKSESPKLSLEPLQMKRKKKGGGYNLRKSLAWDRAFFTEEGILDPLELSSISEVSCREDDYVGKDRKKDWSSSKLDSSSSNLVTSTSLTSHKFQTHLGSKPGSRCGDCPRPLPSPSLKRPANINVGKAAGKELKLPKVHGLKPGSSPTCATTRSSILRANRVKNYQIMQPDFSIQRHAEPKSCSKSLKNTQNASRANTLQSAHHSDGNSGNSSLRRYSSISMSTAMVDTVDNSASKMFSDNATPIGLEMSSVGQRYDSTAFEAPASQSAHNSGKAIHPSQSIMARPTGLRMPSPSLSFFSQPKPSVYWDLPQRNTETDVFGSQKPGNMRLQDNLKKAKLSSRIPESTISSSKAVCSKTECMASSHVTAVELVQPNSEQNPVLKIQDLPQKNVLARISHEAEMQKIGSEVPSQIESCEPAMDKRLKKAVDGYPVKSESHELKWRNTEFGSKQNCIIEESETINAIDGPPKEKDTCNYFVLDHGSTQCTDALNDRVQNTLTMQRGLRKTCKLDCHEPQKEKTALPNFFLGESIGSMDKDKNVLVKKERTSEQLGVPQQNGSCCSGSIKALEQRQIKTKNAYFASKHQCADLLNKSASLEVLTDTLSSGEAHMQNSVFALTIEGCENDIISMLEAGDDIIQPRKSAEVQDVCCKVEMELQRTLKLNSSDRLSLEKQISCQISQQGENIERLPFVVSDGKDGNKVIGSKMPISLSPGRWHDSNLGEDKIISPPTGIKFDSANNLLSSECVTSSVITSFECNDRHQGNANMLLNGTAHENLSHYIHQDTQRTEIVNCSPLPVSRINRLSQKDTLEKATEEVSCIQEVSSDSRLISTMSLKDCASDTDNLRCLQETGAVLVQSPERNMLNDCCPKQSECMALPSDGFVAENCVHSNDRLQTKSPADVYSEDDPLGSMEDSVTGQNEMFLDNLTRSSPAKESSLIHEIGNDSYETGDHIADAITNPLIVKPSSEIIKDEGTNSSPSCLQPKLDHVKVEAASAPKNTHQNGLNEKSRSIILPQNAVPFSDEWLAAIEAAGEDILTKKTGAVQNSPPDKSLPEPSPWSPVKRKNNQIGPFDCTKFTAPSGST